MFGRKSPRPLDLYCKLTILFVLSVMPPKVDLAARKAMEAAAFARAAEKKQKRSAAQVSQYELKRMRRGPWVDPPKNVVVRLEVEIALTVSPGIIPLRVPLVEAADRKSTRLNSSH